MFKKNFILLPIKKVTLSIPIIKDANYWDKRFDKMVKSLMKGGE